MTVLRSSKPHFYVTAGVAPCRMSTPKICLSTHYIRSGRSSHSLGRRGLANRRRSSEIERIEKQIECVQNFRGRFQKVSALLEGRFQKVSALSHNTSLNNWSSNFGPCMVSNEVVDDTWHQHRIRPSQPCVRPSVLMFPLQSRNMISRQSVASRDPCSGKV